MDYTNYETMLDDGYTAVMAKYYLRILEAERKKNIFGEEYTAWAHSHGFSAWCCKMWGLNIGDSLDSYFSDYEYYRLFPMNSWERIWVNDKLTLKLILNGTACSHLMPDYYYYSTPRGLMALSENPYGCSDADFITCLKQFKHFACKPNNGCKSNGFCTMRFADNHFYLNEQMTDEQGILDFVKRTPNYVFTEYLKPDEFWSAYSKRVHTIRINTINANGDNPIIVNSHMRLPTALSNQSNRVDYATAQEANLYVQINLDSHKMQHATLCYASRFEKADKHPDTGAPLNIEVEGYAQCAEAALQVCKLLPNLEWLGFDFTITDKGCKLMEINTHGDHSVDQINKPALLNPVLRDYISAKQRIIDEMTEEQKKVRNAILR